MTTFYAQLADNWDASGQWNTAANGSGSSGTPGNGDTCDLNGKAVVWNLATIPASGTLTEIKNTVASGGLTLTTSGTNTYTLNCSTVTGSSLTTALITIAGAAAGATVVWNGTIIAGMPTNGAFYKSSTGVFNVNGTVAGGAAGWCIRIDAGTVTVTGNVTHSNGIGGAINRVGGTLVVIGNVTGGSVGIGISVNTNNAGSLTVTGNVTGGSATNATGITVTSNTTTTITGSLTAGSATGAVAINHSGALGFTLNTGNIIHSTSCAAYHGRITYNPGTGNYIQTPSSSPSTIKLYREDAQVTASQVQNGVTFWANGVSGTGTYMQTASGLGLNASDLRYGVTVSDVVGALHLPTASQVLTGITFGYNSEYTGTITLPTTSNVIVGVQYGAGGTQYTGTFTVNYPSQTVVYAGTVYGNSNQYTGNMTLPSAGNVREGIQYGANGNDYTGNLRVPDPSDVRDGVGYDTGPGSIPGTCAVPDPADVQDGVAVDATVGTFVSPDESDVATGVQYGSSSEFVGTLGGGTITITVP